MFLIRPGKTVLIAAACALGLSAGKEAVHAQSVINQSPDAFVRSHRDANPGYRTEEVRVMLRGRALVLHAVLPARVSNSGPVVFYSSGSGGWHGFDQHVATALAERGIPVFGISTHTYLKKFYSQDRPATFAAVAADYTELIRRSQALAGGNGSRPVILAGWSLGAGYAPLVACDAGVRPGLSGVISISLSRDNETTLSLPNRLLSRLTGKTIGPSFDVSEYLNRAAPVPVAIIQAGKDRGASPQQAQKLISQTNADAGSSLRLFAVTEARNHSFKDAGAEFDQVLDEALGWIGTKTPTILTVGSLQTGKAPATDSQFFTSPPRWGGERGKGLHAHSSPSPFPSPKRSGKHGFIRWLAHSQY
jgi:alpha-beta hydrolase superfamily lysophospholipase